MDNNNKVVLITGASSGLGLECAKLFAANGCIVYGAQRTNPNTNNINYLYLDLFDEKSMDSVFREILTRHNRIDILINCAGAGVAGAVEGIPKSALEFQMDINFNVHANMCAKILPVFRKQGGGRIINIGSAAYIFPIPFQAYYSASKAALNSFTYALRNEVKDYNIKVSVIHFGDVKTSFTENRKVYALKSYAKRDLASVAVMEKDEQNGMAPKVCAKTVYAVAVAKNPRLSTVCGFKYKCLSSLTRFLPKSMVNLILYKMYCPKVIE